MTSLTIVKSAVQIDLTHFWERIKKMATPKKPTIIKCGPYGEHDKHQPYERPMTPSEIRDKYYYHNMTI